MNQSSHRLNASAVLSEPGDFSLVLGGPLYQLWRRLHLSGSALELLARRVIGIPLVAWLPLLALTASDGVAIGTAVSLPFLAVIQVALAALVPLAPLVLTVVPAGEILKQLLGMLL